MDQRVWNDLPDLPLLEIVTFDLEFGERVIWSHDASEGQTLSQFGVRDWDYSRVVMPRFDEFQDDPVQQTFFLRVSHASGENPPEVVSPEPRGRYLVAVRNVLPVVHEFEGFDSERDNPRRLQSQTQMLLGTLNDFVDEGQIDGCDAYLLDLAVPTRVYFEVTAVRHGVYLRDERGQSSYLQTALVLYRGQFPQEDEIPIGASLQGYFGDPALGMLLSPGFYRIEVHATDSFLEEGDEVPYLLAIERHQVPFRQEAEMPGDNDNDAAGLAEPIRYGDFVKGSVDNPLEMNPVLDATDQVDFYSFEGQAGDLVWLRRYDRQNFDQANHDVTLELIDGNMKTVCFSEGSPEALITEVDTGGEEGQGDCDVNDPLSARIDLQTTRTVLQRSGTYFVRVSVTPGSVDDMNVSSCYAFQIKLAKRAPYESEPNDLMEDADALDVCGRAAGAISSDLDMDTYCFTAVQGEVVTFSVLAGEGYNGDGDLNHAVSGSKMKPMVQVANDLGVPIAEAKYEPYSSIDLAFLFSGGGREEQGGGLLDLVLLGFNRSFNGTPQSIATPLPTLELTFVAPRDGVYYLMVTDEAMDFSRCHYYLIERRDAAERYGENCLQLVDRLPPIDLPGDFPGDFPGGPDSGGPLAE